MVTPPSSDLASLACVADEVREEVSARGYRVDEALDADDAFGSGTSRSALFRDLVMDVSSRAASEIGLDFRSVNGSGREFRSLVGEVDRRYRLRRGRRRSDGTIEVLTSAESVLGDSNPLSLFTEEQWVFIFVPNEGGQIDEMLIGRVLGKTDGNPGRLVLDDLQAVGAGGEAPDESGFLPTDDPLPWGDDEEEAPGEEDVS